MASHIPAIERALGNLSEQIYKIRELITRFEVCHFKYPKHYRHITESIAILKSTVDIGKIGANHPRHGEKIINNDTTGRSQVGQQYISALRFWLDNTSASPKDLVGVNEFENKKFSDLSGGMKTKVGMTMALVSNADLLFLDEPTTGLDPQSRRETGN